MRYVTVLISSTWYLVISAVALVVALISGLVGGFERISETH